MVEERSFENPEFARGAKKSLATFIGIAAMFISLEYLGIEEWTRWARMLTQFVGFIAVLVIVDVAFFKFGGVPMRPWFRRR